MGGSWLTAIFFSCVAVLTVGALWFRVFRPMLEGFGILQAVSDYDDDGPDYVTSGYDAPASRGVVSLDRKAETAKDAETETPRNAAPAFDVNVLRHEARAAALGALLAHGLITPGKRTEAMRAVFGKVTGDAYTRAAGAVKRHEQQVLATLPPVEAGPEPEAPRLVPISGGKEGYLEM